jgi:hypothetical protein
MLRVFDRVEPSDSSQLALSSVLPSAKDNSVGAPDFRFRGSMAGLRLPLSTLRRRPRGRHRMTRGQGGSLLLSCIELASTILRQFHWRTIHSVKTAAWPWGGEGLRQSGRELCAIRVPIPRQELIEFLYVVIVGAREHVGEPSLRVDVVEPRGLDQRVHHGGTLTAAI